MLSSADFSSWVQAIGSVGAILVAAYLPHKQHKRDINQKAKDNSEKITVKYRSLLNMTSLALKITSSLASFLKDYPHLPENKITHIKNTIELCKSKTDSIADSLCQIDPISLDNAELTSVFIIFFTSIKEYNKKLSMILSGNSFTFDDLKTTKESTNKIQEELNILIKTLQNTINSSLTEHPIQENLECVSTNSTQTILSSKSILDGSLCTWISDLLKTNINKNTWHEPIAYSATFLTLVIGFFLGHCYDPAWFSRFGALIGCYGVLLATSRRFEKISSATEKLIDAYTKNVESQQHTIKEKIITNLAIKNAGSGMIKIISEKQRLFEWHEVIIVIIGSLVNGFGEWLLKF